MADTKITALTEDTAPVSTDITVTVDDPSGTPVTKKATLANVITKAHGLSDGIVKVASSTMTAATAGTDYYAPGGTDIPLTDGGTGASSASAARTNLGLDAHATYKSKTDATTSPGSTDDTNAGYTVGSIWVDVTNDKSYICVDATASNAVWNDLTATAGGGIGNVVEDTTPQLGGQLDVNGNAIGDGTLELVKFSETASAVNEITITNAATAGSPSITATGDDTNIDLTLDGKGSGTVKTLSSNLDVTGNIVVSGTVDGRDVATDGTKLDGIETGADVTDATNVAAAGAHMSGGTDVPVADGGTGASTASGARTNLGLVIGTDVAAETSTTSQSGSTKALKSATTTVDVSAATAPTSGQVLTATSGTAATWQTPAGGGGGQSPYDLIVAASGGDYTTLGAALNAASAGDTIYVMSGTYTESTALSTAPANVTVIGQNRQNVTIDIQTSWTLPSGLTLNNLTVDLSNSAVLTIGNSVKFESIDVDMDNGTAVDKIVGTGTDVEWKDCYFYNESATNTNHNNQIDFDGARLKVHGCTFYDSKSGTTGNFISLDGDGLQFTNNFIRCGNIQANMDYIYLSGADYKFDNNRVIADTTSTSTCLCIRAQGAGESINSNTIQGWVTCLQIIGMQYGTVNGNKIVTHTAGTPKGIQAFASDVTYAGNNIASGLATTGIGVDIYGGSDNCVVTGNRIYNFATGVNITDTTSAKNLVVGNNLVGNTTGVNDSGTTSTVANNAT